MKILVVDDHAVVREGVAAVLRQEIEAVVILDAPDVAAAITVADAQDIDLVLLDLSMPGVSGMAGLDAFAARHAAIPVVVLSSSEAEADVRASIAHGALGYIAKSAKPATLIAAIRLVLSGETYLPSFMADSRVARDHRHGQLAALTERQRDVLQLVSDNASNKEIAYRLMISEKTVKAHLTAIFRALDVDNRHAAATAARLELP